MSVKSKKILCSAMTSFRKMENLSLEDAAKKLDIFPDTLRRIEEGDCNFSFDLLIKISHIYKFEIVFEEI